VHYYVSTCQHRAPAAVAVGRLSAPQQQLGRRVSQPHRRRGVWQVAEEGGWGCLRSDAFDAEGNTISSLLAVRPGEADLPARLQELCVLSHLAGSGNRLLQGKCDYLQVICA